MGILLAISFIAGCSMKPADVPDLCPYSVEVVNTSNPITGAQVIFYPTQGGGSLTMCGTTDNRGIAKMTTVRGSFVGNGVPQGKYNVVVMKYPEVPHWKTPEELSKMSTMELDKYGAEMDEKANKLPVVIPEILTSQTETPVEVEVSPDSDDNELKVDVAPYF